MGDAKAEDSTSEMSKSDKKSKSMKDSDSKDKKKSSLRRTLERMLENK
jgi:hypothetical protein